MTQPPSAAALTTLLLPPYDNDCYVVACRETGEAIIVDAPSNAEVIAGAVARLRCATSSSPTGTATTGARCPT